MKLAYVPDPALSYWPTPPRVACAVVFQSLEPWMLPWGEGIRVLEPSAGEGHLAAEIRAHLPAAHITCIEPSAERADQLRRRRGATCGDPGPASPAPYDGTVADEVIESTLEDYLADVAIRALTGAWQPFDLVVMNPPFTLDGHPEAWAEHILALYRDPNILGEGGTLNAIVPRIVMTGGSRRCREVRHLLAPGHGVSPCERDAFAPVGAKVSTALLWVEKSDGIA